MADYSERSPLWGVGSTTALLGGAAYALHKSRGAIANAVTSRAGSINESIISAVAKAPGFNVGRSYSSVLDEATQGYLTTIQSKTSLGIAQRDLFHSAYESMVSTGKLTSNQAIEKLAGINEQTNILGSYGIATKAIQEAEGDTNLFARRIKDLASGRRLEQLSGLEVSPGGYGTGLMPTLKYSDLGETFKARERAIKDNLIAAQGDKFKVSFGSRYTGTAQNPLMSVMVGEQQYNIPLNVNAKSMSIGGTNYTLRGAYGPGGNKMSYSELMETTISDMLANSRNQTELRNEIHKANQTLIQSMKDRDSAKFAAAIWSAPNQALTSGGLAVNRLRNIEAIGYDVTPGDIESVIGRGLYPYTSPSSAAKGTMTTEHLAQYLYGDLGLLVSPEARPGQFLRSEWGSTKAAKAAAIRRGFAGEFGKYYNRLERKSATAGYQKLVYGGLSATDELAYSAPQLMTFYAKPAGSNMAGLGFNNPVLNRMLAAEEGVLSPAVAGMMEHERSFTKRIALGKGLETNKGILAALADKAKGEFVPLNINAPAYEDLGVGVSARGGERITLKQSDALSQRIVGAQMAGPDEAIIHFKESRKLSSGELLKTFSEEQKALVGIRPKDEFEAIVQAAAGRNKIAGQDIEQVLAGKLVQRNKMALITQQMEAMSAFAASKLQPGMDPIAEGMIRSFLADPAKASMVSELMARESENAHLAIQRNLIGLARGFGFTGEELGMTFGLADEAALQGAGLTPLQTQSILRSQGVIGLGKGRVGDLVSSNWGRGSFEHTGFRLLAMKGQEGIDYAAELSKRVLNKGELGALGKMEATILGEESLINKISRGDISKFTEGELISKQGRYVDLGVKLDVFGRSNVLYIPGTQEAPYTMSRVAANNQEIRKPIEKELSYFRSVLEKFHDKRTTQEELELAGKGLKDAVLRATEEQASARGKIVGSRIVTNIRRGSGDAFGMAKVDIERMYRDLLERATDPTQIEELARQKQTLQEGGVVASGLWRHPTTGPESFQFVNIKMDQALKEGTIAVPYREAKLTIAGKGTRTIDLSPMTGLKADFDRDQLVISAISNRDTQARVSKQIGNQIKQGYASYLFNHYGMKDFFEGQISKGEVLKMNSAEALLSGYKKLTTAKSTTGQVNLALQQFKLGLAYSAPEKYRPAAELFWHLEEAVIGGKHGIMGENLYQAIADAAKGGESGVRSMEQVLATVFGGTNISLTGDITTEAGETFAQNLSFNTNELARQAVESGSSVRNEVKAAMDAAQIGRGKTITHSLSQDVERMFLRKRGSIDVAGLVMQANAEDMTGIGSKAGRVISSLNSKATSVLNAVKRNKKGLLVGGAVAAGLMFMAPSVSGVIRNPNQSGGGMNLGEEELMPGGGQPMSPPPPRPNRSPRIYDVSGGRPTTHANIRMRMDDFTPSSRDFMASAGAMSSNNRVNINTRDNRQVTDPIMLANKIHERL